MDSKYTNAETFRYWVLAMRNFKLAHTDKACAEALGISQNALVTMKKIGCDRRTSLACAALLQGLSPLTKTNTGKKMADAAKTCASCAHAIRRSEPVDEECSRFENLQECKLTPRVAVADWYNGETVMRGTMRRMPYVCEKHEPKRPVK